MRISHEGDLSLSILDYQIMVGMKRRNYPFLFQKYVRFCLQGLSNGSDYSPMELLLCIFFWLNPMCIYFCNWWVISIVLLVMVFSIFVLHNGCYVPKKM